MHMFKRFIFLLSFACLTLATTQLNLEEKVKKVFGTKERCRFRLEVLPQEFVSLCFEATEKDVQILKEQHLGGSALLNLPLEKLEKLQFSTGFLERIKATRYSWARILADTFYLSLGWLLVIVIVVTFGILIKSTNESSETKKRAQEGNRGKYLAILGTFYALYYAWTWYEFDMRHVEHNL